MMLLARAGCDRARYAHGGRPVGRTAGACECARAGLEGLGAGRQSTAGVVEQGGHGPCRAPPPPPLFVCSSFGPPVSGLSRARSRRPTTSEDEWRRWRRRRRATWFPAATAPDDRPGGRRQTTRVARRRRSRTHRPRAAALVDAHRCDAVVPRVRSSTSRGRGAGGSEREKKRTLLGGTAARACRRPRCSAGSAAGAPPPGHGRRPLLLPALSWTLAARARVLHSRPGERGRKAAAGRPLRTGSTALALLCCWPTTRDGPGTGESRWPGRAARQPATVAPPPRGQRPGCSCRCRCKVIGRARAAAAAKQDPLGGARASRALVPLAGDGRLEHTSSPVCSVPVRTGSTRRLSPRLSEPGRNLLPPAGPPAAPPRRPHYPSAAAWRVTFAPGCCSSFLPSAQLSCRPPPPPPLGSSPANASGLDHTTLSIPHLVRSGKSSSVGRG